MEKIKLFRLLTLLLLLVGWQQLFGQNVFWVESSFNSPRLVKTGSDGSTLLSKALPAGSLPQSIALGLDGQNLFWGGLSFINAQITATTTDFTKSAVIMDSQSVVRGIALDPSNKKIYWISTNLVNGPKIWRADMDGASPTVLIDFGSGSNNTPRSISLDVPAGKMYWTNFGKDKIQRADMTISAVPEDIVNGLNGPSGLAVDADSGKIFWTEMNSGQIRSADLDGTNMALLVDQLSHPNYLAVNYKLNKMVWTELGSGLIKSANLDGSDVFTYPVHAISPAGIVIEVPVDSSYNGAGKLVTLPPDTTVQIGNIVQFKAQFIDSLGVGHDTDAFWSVSGNQIGAISNDGLFFPFFPGSTKIMARVDSIVAESNLVAVDTSADSTVNTISIVRKFHGFKDKHTRIIKEGREYVLGGVPHPFNVVNGIKVYFPKGCLHEDISIEIKLPSLAKIRADSCEFANKIINGIQFDVFVKDSLIKPYYFDKPVSVSLPFKRGILRKLGIDPARLGMFFAQDSVTFDSLGISHVMVDSSNNRIYALVEHFSSLVVHDKDAAVTNNPTNENIKLPENFVLKQNYPNPFNPVTTISYQLPKYSQVELSIYNVLGQKVATLVSGRQEAGTYNVEWDASGFGSGIYLYKLQTNQGFTQSRKLILLK